MSGLVGYESSSGDEEEGNVKADATSIPVTTVKKDPGFLGTATPQEHKASYPETQDESLLGPVVGPARGDGNGSSGLLEDPREELTPDPNLTPSSPYSAERNNLRALTDNSFMAASIPPSPPSSPDSAANAKFARFLELKSKGVHFNADLAGKSSFGNPSLFSNMLIRAGLTEQEQYVSTLPEKVWAASMFPDWAYKEGLLQQQRDLNQKLETERKAQSAAGKRTIDWVGESQSHVSDKPSTPTKRKRP